MKNLQILVVAGLLIAGPFSAQDHQGEQEPSYSFVVVGHVRGAVYNQPYYLMDELIAEVGKLKPDLIFFTGDMIFGDWLEPNVDAERVVAHWDRFDKAVARLGIPIYRVPGNHDINDPITRDIYFQRYGELPQAVTFDNSRFLLLATSHIPEGDAPPQLPRPHSRVLDLPAPQVGFVSRELEMADRYSHVFIFMHHMVWWSPERTWWRDVHPLMTDSNVRAVFAGDFGPSKFSHLNKDGVDYFHTALSDWIPAQRLRTNLGRVLNFQFDNFLHVTVNGEEVNIDVKVLGAKSTGKYTPEYWDTVFDVNDDSAPSMRQRVRGFLGSKSHRAMLVILLVGVFILGNAAAWFWLKRAKRR